MGHHLDSDGRFQSDKHPSLPPDRVRLSLERSENWPGLLLIADAYLDIDREFGEDLRDRVLELRAADVDGLVTRTQEAVADAVAVSATDGCEHAYCRVDANSVLVADNGPRHGKRHLAIRARCEQCRRLFVFGDVLTKGEDGTHIELALVAGPVDPTPQCAACRKDMPGQPEGICNACAAEARAVQPPEPAKTGTELAGPRGTIRPVGTASLVHPGAALYGFVGWLTTRDEKAVFSSTDDAAGAAELVAAYCDAQGWSGADLVSSMKMLLPGPAFTTNRCGNSGECVGCRDCEAPGS